MNGFQDTNGNLTLDELYEAANEMCRKHWGVDYTGTIRYMGGYWCYQMACYTWDDEVREIRFNRRMNSTLTREEVLDNLLHELVHWRLHTTGQPSSDVDAEFVHECIRVGASFSHEPSAQRAAQKYGGVAI
ncbi:hypothetical protein EEL32_22515 [Brevibacillus laterosporus]|nr:hypothetical protein [Brevibacillus laterosporus]TPG77705.1 hypothetical protein EEL32_22515 [Brevibacillus laterosporus]